MRETPKASLESARAEPRHFSQGDGCEPSERRSRERVCTAARRPRCGMTRASRPAERRPFSRADGCEARAEPTAGSDGAQRRRASDLTWTLDPNTSEFDALLCRVEFGVILRRAACNPPKDGSREGFY